MPAYYRKSQIHWRLFYSPFFWDFLCACFNVNLFHLIREPLNCIFSRHITFDMNDRRKKNRKIIDEQHTHNAICEIDQMSCTLMLIQTESRRQMFLTFSQIGYFSSNCIDNKRIQFYRLYLSWVPFSLPFSHNMYGMAVDMHARTYNNNSTKRRQLIRNQLQEAIISHFMPCSRLREKKTTIRIRVFRFSALVLLQIIPRPR